MSKNNNLFGILLVLAGGFLLLERLQIISGDIFLLLLGLVFITVYFIKGRVIGFLIPGSFLTWFGLYTFSLEQTYYPQVAEYSAGLLFLFLGLAFLTICLHTVKYNRNSAKYWPLYPGISLLIFALIIEFEFSFIPEKYFSYLKNYWPAVLIICGLIIFLTSNKQKNIKK